MGFRGLLCWLSKDSSLVKNLPAMQETWVWSLGWEDPLEEGMATHSSTVAWRTPQTEEPGGLQYIGLQRVGHDWSDLPRTHLTPGPTQAPAINQVIILFALCLIGGPGSNVSLGSACINRGHPRSKTKMQISMVVQGRLCSQCRGLGFNSWSEN